MCKHLIVTKKIRAYMRCYNKRMACEITSRILDEMNQSTVTDTELGECRVIAKVLETVLSEMLHNLKSDSFTVNSHMIHAKCIYYYLKPPRCKHGIDDWLSSVVRHYIPFVALTYELK